MALPLLALPLLALSLTPAHATVNVDTDDFVYTQDFNSLTTSTTPSTWANNGTLAGWYLYTSTLADAATILAGAGEDGVATADPRVRVTLMCETCAWLRSAGRHVVTDG
jgi:hypothetical protein